jgi:hypothetical protein
MNLLKKHIVTLGLLTAIGLAPLAAQAESDSGSGASPSAAARLNLQVVIPAFLLFRIGSTGATIDTITFSPGAAVVGDSSSVSGLGGDAAAGSGASVQLRSNGGQVTIAETNDGGGNGLNGTATDISLTEISVSSDAPTLETPTLSDAGGNTSSPTLTGGSVTNRSAVWTYAYNNTTVPDADTYDVEITYTASTP